MGWEFTLLIIGLLIVIVVALLIIGKQLGNRNKTCGILNIDCGEPENGPYLYLELKVPIADIIDQKRITFDVNVIPNSSQK